MAGLLTLQSAVCAWRPGRATELSSNVPSANRWIRHADKAYRLQAANARAGRGHLGGSQMARVLRWLGGGCIAAGILLIAVNVAMHFMGLTASYNIGDPSKFEFILISFWHIGAALIVAGGLAAFIARRMA